MPDDTPSPCDAEVERLRRHVLCVLRGRVRDFRVVATPGGLVLTGRTATYHLKQLSQEAIMGATSVPVVANRIEVD